MKRSYLVFLQVASLLLVFLTVWAGYLSFSSESWTPRHQIGLHPPDAPAKPATSKIYDDTIISDHVLPPIVSPSPGPGPGPESEPEAELAVDLKPSFNVTPYIQAITDPKDATLPRLECPPPNITRYRYLNAPVLGESPRVLKYFFALDLRQAVDVIPRLLGSIVEAVRFLGPSACALSIVEGNSDDGTHEILHALQEELAKLGIAYSVQSSDVDPTTGERITKLAQLRNLALSPLVTPAEVPVIAARAATDPVPPPDASTTVIFLNDVAPCVTDILELIHQRAFQEADMTCAMDWTYVGRDPTFYDVWVARTLRGDLFFDIPPDGSWNSAWNLFWNDVQAKARFSRVQPFQVFACWDGAVAFGAAPLLREGDGAAKNGGRKRKRQVEFRASREGECQAGEPTLFCKDLWWNGFGRIAVVPSVNLEYSNEAAKKIKDLKGYTSRWTEQEDSQGMKVEWVDDPPDMVRCMPGLGDQSWRPWNETLV